MLRYPNINPVALDLGFIKIHWYGLAYLLGLLLAWALLAHRIRKGKIALTQEQLLDLIFYAAIGIVVGGRFFYMLVYDYQVFFHKPWVILKIWEGGMSFHGGLLGVILAMILFARRHKQSFADLMDFIAPVVPLGLGAGRIGNFINDELWGRVTNVPWGMVFPNGGPLPRHPSQLYEFLLEGILLFIILWSYSAKKRPPFAVSGLFLTGYGVFRCFAEFYRQPDAQLGYLGFGWLTMGQVLSFPMIVLGVVLLVWAYRRKAE